MSAETSNRGRRHWRKKERKKKIIKKKSVAAKEKLIKLCQVVSDLDSSPNVGDFSVDLVNSPRTEKWMLSSAKQQMLKTRRQVIVVRQGIQPKLKKKKKQSFKSQLLCVCCEEWGEASCTKVSSWGLNRNKKKKKKRSQTLVKFTHLTLETRKYNNFDLRSQ